MDDIPTETASEPLDVAIVGGGPAGLAAADAFRRAGLRVVVFEKGVIADPMLRYPTYMTWFSTTELLELGGMPFPLPRPKPTREEYLAYLRRFTRERRIDVRLHHEAVSLEGAADDFLLRGRTARGEAWTARARRVVLAFGAFGTPRRLGVPGDDLPHVHPYYSEPHPYFGSKVLVVGGRNSAVETALELWRSGVDVSIAYRGERFRSVKYWLEPDIENRIAKGEIPAFRPADLVEVRPGSVLLRPRGGEVVEVAADFVLSMIGHEPDPALLARFGVGRDPATGIPRHDPATLESDRPGVFVIGVMISGNVSGEIFIENSRFHGDRVLERLRATGFRSRPSATGAASENVAT